MSDAVAGAAQLTIGVLLLAGTAEIWHLIALQVVRGTASAFFFPAMTGVVPETVSLGRLQQANAVLGISRNATQITGAAAGGILVALVGSGWAITIDGLTYFAGGAFLVLIRLAPRALPERHFLRELKEGWDDFRSRTWLWAIVVQFAFVNPAWVGAFMVLGPVVAERDLGGPAAWGLVLASQSAGLLFGGLVMLRYRPQRPLYVATLSTFLMALPLLSLAVPMPLALVAAAAFISGVGLDVFGVLWTTALHEHVPPDRLARVSSYDAVGSFVFSPIGFAIAGTVAAAVGTAETLLGAVVVVVVASAVVLLSNDVRTLPRGRPQATETPTLAAL